MDDPEKTQDSTSETTKETSEKEPETFTREQVGEAERKGKSDGLAEVGRLRADNQRLVESSQKLNTRVERMIRENEDAELESARDNTEKTSAIQERQARRRVETDLATVQQELDETNNRIKQLDEKEVESTKERNAREIATRLGVDSKRLVKLAKFTDGSSEAIEEIAEELPKKGGDKKSLEPDSGRTSGVGKGRTPSLEELQASTAQEYGEKVKSGEWKM